MLFTYFSHKFSYLIHETLILECLNCDRKLRYIRLKNIWNNK